MPSTRVGITRNGSSLLPTDNNQVPSQSWGMIKGEVQIFERCGTNSAGHAAQTNNQVTHVLRFGATSSIRAQHEHKSTNASVQHE